METLTITTIVGLNRLSVDKICHYNLDFLIGKPVIIRSNQLLEELNPVSGILTKRYDTEIGIIFVLDENNYHVMEDSEVAIFFENDIPKFIFYN